MPPNTTRRSNVLRSAELASCTLSHLFHGSNHLHITAPTVSRHLSRSLCTSVTPDEMSLFAQRMHCKRCSALMTMASTRVRQPSRRPRRGENRHNCLVRRCTACGWGNREDGIEERVGRKDGELSEELTRARERIDKELRRKVSGTLAGEGQRKVGENRQVVGGRVKKKKKKREKDGRERKPRNGQQTVPAGLAASFLFDTL